MHGTLYSSAVSSGRAPPSARPSLVHAVMLAHSLPGACWFLGGSVDELELDLAAVRKIFDLDGEIRSRPHRASRIEQEEVVDGELTAEHEGDLRHETLSRWDRAVAFLPGVCERMSGQDLIVLQDALGPLSNVGGHDALLSCLWIESRHASLMHAKLTAKDIFGKEDAPVRETLVGGSP